VAGGGQVDAQKWGERALPSPLDRLWQNDAREKPGKRLREVFALGWQQPKAGSLPASEESFQEDSGHGKDVVEIHHPNLGRKLTVAESAAVQKGLVPDLAVGDVVAGVPPCLGRRVLAGLLHRPLPHGAECGKWDMKAQHDISHFGVLEVASLRHNNDIGFLGVDSVSQELKFGSEIRLVRCGDPS
jgi:hypothetical protein